MHRATLRALATNPILALAWRALQWTRLDARLFASQVPALWADGWFRSRREGRCVDLNGDPVPWLAYPAIEFLARRLRPEMAIFEYGCGASTLWWAARVGRVVAVDHDEAWARSIGAQVPGHARVEHVPLDDSGAYARNATAHGILFDVVVIDGRDRVRCVRPAVQALRPSGVIVFDNSDRSEYAEGYRALAEAGFRRLDFIGMAPVIDYKTQTSIYYRSENCLGI